MFLLRLLTKLTLWMTNVETQFQPRSNPNVGSGNIEARQASGVIAPKNFLRRGNHASIVIGDYVYIDGGEVSSTNNGRTVYQYSNDLLSINLSQDWQNSTVVMQTITKPDGLPDLNRPSLWYNDQENVMYCGFTGDVPWFGSDPSVQLPLPPPLSLWAFKPDGTGSGIFTEVIGPNNTAWQGLVRPDSSLMAYGSGKAYILGGTEACQWDYLCSERNCSRCTKHISGMVTFDMSTQEFSNDSVTGVAYTGESIFQGVMTYVEVFGLEGIFIVMGGRNETLGLSSFAALSVYDPVEQQWYVQRTTGEPPSPRISFCSAGVSSNNGTYEIFVYGGLDGDLGPTSKPYDTISILTLPAFHWVSDIQHTEGHPRFGHTCHAVGGSQILITGGMDPNTPAQYINGVVAEEEVFNTSADPFSQGLAVFDMTTLTFADQFTAKAPPYEQSQLVKDYYSQVLRSDYISNLNPNVLSLVSNAHFSNTSTNTSSSPTPVSSTVSPTASSTNSTSSATASSSHTNAGAITGGTIGGVIALGLAASAIFFVFRRRGNKNSSSESPATGNNSLLLPLEQGSGPHEMFQDGAELDNHGWMEMKPVEMPRNERPAELEMHR